MRSMLQFMLLSLLFSVTASQGTQKPGSILVTVLDSDPVTYRSQIASFGDNFQDDSVMATNLMVPPDDATLCDYPPSLINMSTEKAQNLTASQSSPFSLLVSRGKCSFDQKARVALAMQQQLTNLLKYMVIYNNNFSTPNDLVVMSTAAAGDSYDDLEVMGFLFLSTNSGVTILDKIAAHENSTGADATFLSGDDNSDWYLPLFLEVVPTRSGGNGLSNTGSDLNATGRNTFYWLRFVLFTLLIVSPCARAGYLWYMAGGRLLLRRNEGGRITGLQYVQPMPYWFASGAEGHYQDDHASSLMTEEDVNALPEILYQRKDEDEDRYYYEKNTDTEASEGRDKTSATTRTKEATDSDAEFVDLGRPASIDVEKAAEELTEEQVVERSEQALNTTDQPKDKIDPLAAATATAAPQIVTTTCTMCSICIDDFEDGEKIRVLPKCRHGFHTECIIPWLTERQSCCPLCKTSVLGRDDNQEETTINTNDATTITSNNNAINGDASADVDDRRDSPA